MHSWRNRHAFLVGTAGLVLGAMSCLVPVTGAQAQTAKPAPRGKLTQALQPGTLTTKAHSAPNGAGARGLNTQYHWVGQFRPGGELWCSTQGMDLMCDHHRPPISYPTDTKSGPIPTASSQLPVSPAALAE